MRVALIAIILSLGAVIVLWLSDNLTPWLLAGPVLLLISIPISLALLSFLSHKEQEQRQEDSSP